MGHVFKAEDRKKLDNPKRREALPISLLEKTNIQKTDIVADIGCGIGYFTFPIASMVSEGKVYALDMQPEMLEDVKRKMQQENYSNVIPVLTKEDDFRMDLASCNVAFICTVLHEIKQRNTFYQQVNAILQKEGSVYIVDWQKQTTDYGPPIDHRLAKEQVTQELEEFGFTEVKVTDVNEYFYLIHGKKR